jgi:alanine dehydrogenase
MTMLDADQVRAGTPWRELLDAIREILRSDIADAPDRHVHDIELVGGSNGSLLIMPSWISGDVVGVKAVTFCPDNTGTAVPTVNAAYLLFSGTDGRLLATLDGDELTARRTAAISALAADHLSRPDAARLLVVGSGQLAPNVAMAYSVIRKLDSIEIWGRNPAAAKVVVGRLAESGLSARVSDDLDASVRGADIISCVTGATDPLVHGADLRAGVHLDLIGSFRADMRESDDAAVLRATLFVDTVGGALESGDLSQPLAAGLITEESISGDLRALVTGQHPGRTDDREITVFKSAGFALADLAAARLAWRRHQANDR